MNSSQAKQIQIINYLNVTGDIKKEVWICSPLHEEQTPSFKINTVKNIWYDHAQGIGGNILDLVMQLNNCELSQALKILEQGNSSFSFSPAESRGALVKEETTKETIIKKIQDLQNPAFVDYLHSRKIHNFSLLKEIYYSQDDKNYFAIAFKNDSEGFETRNAYFKGCIGSKDITTIKGTRNNNLSVFEGFMDYLSALQHFKITEFQNDVIILNSTANKFKINDLLYSEVYSNIYLFLDNDKSGIEAKQYLYDINNKCVDCSNIYDGFKDFNEFLTNK